ncbi:MAG TPA: prolyl oligopeptidase family serine peptidase [Candidatus Acidoferrum sp.]|nr:prolyl oligopeptidase family serine peptidase [Candidatus Acidoferrum sp.]
MQELACRNLSICAATTRMGKSLFSAALFLATCAIFAQFTSAQTTPGSPKCPPATRIDSAKDAYGTTVVADPYRWLEDQDSPETRAWIDAEQKCTEAALLNLPGRAQIAKRLGELLHTDAFEAPVERGGRYFFRKRPAGQDLYLLYIRRGLNAPDEVLIDPLPWSPDHSASVTLENISRDGKFVFYGRREGGQDEITPRVLEVDTKETLPDPFPSGLYFSIEPTPDNKALYYVRKTADGPRAFYHRMGDDPANDAIIFGKDLGKEKILNAQLSEDGTYLTYLVIYGSGSEKTELYVQNVKENGPVLTAVNDEKSIFYPTYGGDRLFILTNWKAPQWRVFSTNLATPQREHWSELIPEGAVHLETIAASGGKLVGQYTHNATSELKIFNSNGKVESSIVLPSLGSVGATSGRWESPELFFSFESFNFVPAIYRYDVKQAKAEVWARNKVQLDSAAFEIEQVWYSSKDKTRIPMFLFHKKGVTRDGSNPVLLTGYGGFDVSNTPYYSPLAIAWVEHGGILAEANLRGGGEFGEEWHRAGMLEKKQNVFDDFIAAAEFLIAGKYTTQPRLAILGGSNGGLLVGAALTQRPELFRAVVCVYPLLDMLRFQKFLEGPYWVPEYGSAENAEQFPYLYKYSPYHHVVDGTKYPSTLFVTGDGDTRVAPLHARKMAARLQAATGSDRPILLLYDTKSGHSGGRPINKTIEEYTDILSFLFWQLRITGN